MQRKLKIMVLALLLLILITAALAIQWPDNGAIEGFITDEAGSVDGALVEARNTMSGIVSRTESDASGYYIIEPLPAGRYALWVQAENHSSYWMPRIVVERGQVVRQDVRLTRIRPTAIVH